LEKIGEISPLEGENFPEEILKISLPEGNFPLERHCLSKRG